MEEEEKDIELIEAYFKGALIGPALEEFERRLSSDKRFADEVQDYMLIMKEVQIAGRRSFSDKMKAWESEIESKTTKTNVIPIRRLFSIAATLLIIASAGAYIIFKSIPSDNVELFNQYFEPYEDVITNRSAGQLSVQTAMNYYNEGKFAEAIKYLEEAMKDNRDNLSIQCYLGIAYLADNQTQMAKEVLESVADSEPGLYNEIADWYLALVYLRQNDVSRLENQLTEIIRQKDHMYIKQAKSLLPKCC